MAFNYNPDSIKPFGVAGVRGHKLSRNIMNKYDLYKDNSSIAGVDLYLHDGNYNPVYLHLKSFQELVTHFEGGFEREAKAQSNYYKNK